MGSINRASEADVSLVPDEPEVSLLPDEPEAEEFGLRANWQSDEERLEAAEFLVATRMQEDVRRRIAKQTLALREQNREKFSTFVAQQTGD